MDTRGRLVAGSHNRNEFILINADEASRVRGLPKPNPTQLTFLHVLVGFGMYPFSDFVVLESGSIENAIDFRVEGGGSLIKFVSFVL